MASMVMLSLTRSARRRCLEAICVVVGWLGVVAAAQAGGGSLPGRSDRRSSDQVKVPAGPFTMGSDPGQGNADEVPAHRPVLEPFLIDRTEVTNRRYRECVKAGTCAAPIRADSKTRRRYADDPRYDDFPAVNLTWYQAQAFCTWAGGRLPTEAEWEKAARGDRDRRAYPWGNKRPDCSLANFGGPDGCGGDTAAVGGRPAGKSPFGAHDMAGNVWEWVSDWYDSAYYRKSPTSNPRGPRWGSFKVMRGGCFDTGPDGLRVSCRNHDLPTSAQPNVGFRCARPGR